MPLLAKLLYYGWMFKDEIRKILEWIFWIFLGVVVVFVFFVALVSGVGVEQEENVDITPLEVGFEYIVHETGEKGVFTQEYIRPAEGSITQGWKESGARAGGKHYAWDFGGAKYSFVAVRAFADGEVVSIDDNLLTNTTLRWRFCGSSGVCWYTSSTAADIQIGYGNVVIVEHEEDLYTLYAHLDTVDVEEGEEIKMGDILGAMGNTGFSTGKHLHFEIWNVADGKKGHVNPKWAFE